MKLRILLLTTLALSFSAFSQVSSSDKDYVNKTLMPSTALLYSQTESGSMEMRCTATAIGQDEKNYTFVTAAHCGCKDNTDKNSVSPEKAFFFIAPDIAGNKIYLKASPAGCGYRTKGDDFFLLTVDKTVTFPIIPLGNNPKLLDQVINIGGPLGIGKQVFLGSVSSPDIDRPIVEPDSNIEWSHAVLLQEFGINGGSSGSSVVCLDQHAICAFVVGTIAGTNMVALPVSRLKTFQEKLADKSYRWYIADPDSPPAKIVSTSDKK